MDWLLEPTPATHLRRVGGDLQDLVAWREAAELARQALLAAKRLHGVGASAAADQIARACESIPANVAEAYGRGLGKDGARFLRVARGSATELESHLWVAERTGRLPQPLAFSLMDQSRRVRALIRGLLLSSSARKSRD